MRKYEQYIYRIIIKIFDWLLVHILRRNYKRISNQYLRTAYHYRFYKYLLKRYANSKIPSISNDGPIWMFWSQGVDNMPPIVRKCYSLAVNNAPKNHNVVLVTQDNYSHYVDIPRYITKKVEEGKITLTHFSDILRVSLLATYGGLWMDATLYSVSLDKGIFERDFFSVRTPDDGQWVSKCLWTGFFMGGVKGHPLFCFMRDLFFDYWKEHDVLVDYFLIDLAISMAYNDLPQIKHSVDKGVEFYDKLHMLQPIMEKPFDPQLYKSYVECCPYYKMTWRNVPPEVLPNGEKTFYGYMVCPQS